MDCPRKPFGAGIVGRSAEICRSDFWDYATVLLCVGIRVNSAVLFGLVMVGFLIKAIQSKDKVWAIGASVIMAGCLTGAWLPGAVSPVKYNAGTLGMVWELTGMASQDKSLRQKLSAYGDVDEAMHRFGEPYLNSIVWDRNPPFPAQKIAGQYAKEITSLYFETAFQEPIHFAKNKWKWVSRTLGISDKLITSSRGVHGVDARTQSLGGGAGNLLAKSIKKFVFSNDGPIRFCLSLPMVCILYLHYFAGHNKGHCSSNASRNRNGGYSRRLLQFFLH